MASETTFLPGAALLEAPGFRTLLELRFFRRAPALRVVFLDPELVAIP